MSCGLLRSAAPADRREAARGTVGEIRNEGVRNRIGAVVDERDLAAIERRIPLGSLFDAGCGTGGFLRSARRRGWSVSGCDADPQRAAICREAHGIDVSADAVESLVTASEAFDAVVCRFSLEHVADPLAVLERLHDRLRPGGVLLVSVPNAAGIPARVFGSRWFAFRIPDHVYHFTPPTLSALARRAGFADVRTDTRFLPQNAVDIAASVWPALDPDGLRSQSGPDATIKRLCLLVLAIAAVPFAAAASVAGRGNSIRLLARKPGGRR